MKFDFTFICTRCDTRRYGVLFFDNLTVADSWGGVLFEDGMTCNICLGEPYEGEAVIRLQKGEGNGTDL